MHSEFSEDGTYAINELCDMAVKRGVTEIAITDHMDMDWPIPKYTFKIKDIDAYVKAVLDAKTKYKHSLKVLLGLELGLEPHTLDESNELLNKYPFDFIIGSFHIAKRKDPYYIEFWDDGKKNGLEMYYSEIHDLVKDYTNFDVLGHMDYPRRYCPEPISSDDAYIGMDINEETFKYLIQNGCGIEINTSNFSRPLSSTMPSIPLLKRYHELDGEILTIGTDSHSPYTIGCDFHKTLYILKEIGFKYITTFEKRVPKMRKIDKFL